MAKQITIIKTQIERQCGEKLEFRNYVFPGILIRCFVGQYVNQQGSYLYNKATTYSSGIKFFGDQ